MLKRNSGKGKFCSKQCARSAVGSITIKRNRAPALKGPKHPAWTGYSIKRQRTYAKSAWKNCKVEVIQRDRYCRLCGDPGNFELHHILPVGRYPMLVCDSGNVIRLCVRCHRRIKGKEKKYAKKLFGVLRNKSSDKPPF
jgi:5-methylcytosine-specific restriction endonuclease McrA